METLLTVAIVLIVSSLVVVAFGTAMQGASQSYKAVATATTMIRIDRHIRSETNNTHIPYWTNAQPYIDNLTAKLYQSNIGPYIKSIRPISVYPKAPRGIEVIYVVNNRELRTVALFPTIAVLDEAR
jgi:hypothetical protein